MLIPKNLFASMEAAQRLMNNPNIQRIQLAMNNVQKLQEAINNSAFQSVNLINQQMSFANLTNLDILAKQINFPDIHRQFESISSNLKILSEVYLKNHNYWNNVINSAIDAYNSTQEEEFEVVIGNFPVIFLKPRLNEYIRIFQNLEIPENISVYLGFASYIFLWLAPYATFVPALEPVLLEVLKWIVVVLKSFGVIVLEYKTPKKFAELTFAIGTPAFISFIFRKLSKK
jgi:hypothetical protein